MFWESMFRDEPRSVRWITFDPKGVPYRYSGGRDPLRFLADPSNPEWIELVKRRVDAAMDASFDAIFFDNAASLAMGPFLGEIRRHIRNEKKSGILFSANHGLIPGPVQLVRGIEDFIFAEGWHEPGVWGSEWNTGNIRRTKYLRGAIPEWKPLTTEYSMFHEGDRATTFLSPRSQKLATAEAAVFQSDHSWDMEGPFAGALMTNDPAALASWKAIGEYRRFLGEHEELYWKARSLSPVLAVMPTTGVSFTWERDETGLFDLLSRNSVLYDIRLASALDRDRLRAYQAVVVPPGVELTPALVEYQSGGGKLYRVPHADENAIAEIRALTAGAPSLAIEGAPRVVGNITRLGSDKGLAVHLLNYDSEPVSGLRVRVNPGKQFSGLAVDPRVMTPDRQGAVTRITRTGTGIEFTLDRLDIYTVVVLRPTRQARRAN